MNTINRLFGPEKYSGRVTRHSEVTTDGRRSSGHRLLAIDGAA